MQNEVFRGNKNSEGSKNSRALSSIKRSGLAGIFAIVLVTVSAPTFAHQSGYGKSLIYYGLAHHFNSYHHRYEKPHYGHRYQKPHYGYKGKQRRYRAPQYRQRYSGNYRNRQHRGQRFSNNFRNRGFRNHRGINHGRFRRN